MSQSVVSNLNIAADISHLVIEDDTPVDNLISEKQQRLLTKALYSNDIFESRSLLVAANVGVFDDPDAED